MITPMTIAAALALGIAVFVLLPTLIVAFVHAATRTPTPTNPAARQGGEQQGGQR